MNTTNNNTKVRQNTDKNSVNKVRKSNSASSRTNTVTDLAAGVFATILILVTLLHMDPANAMVAIMTG